MELLMKTVFQTGLYKSAESWKSWIISVKNLFDSFLEITKIAMTTLGTLFSFEVGALPMNSKMLSPLGSSPKVEIDWKENSIGKSAFLRLKDSFVSIIGWAEISMLKFSWNYN